MTQNQHKKIRNTRYTACSFSLVCIYLLISPLLYAQQEVPDSQFASQRDIIDLINSMQKNKGRHEARSQSMAVGHVHWSLVPGAGYTLGNGFTASLTGNASFYTSAQPTQNISSITGVATITAKKQFMFVLQPSIWVSGNKRFFAGDYRFMINPLLNFGLGGNSKLYSSNVIDYRFIRVYQYAYFRLKPDLFGGVGYHYNYHHRISSKQQLGKPAADCRRYGLPKETTSSGLSLNLLYDHRRNLNNPVAGGQYLQVQWINYLKALGSTSSWQNLIVDARRYIGLGRTKQSKLALWGYGSFSFGKTPYLELPSTACDANNNMGRGYVTSRFRGQNLLYGEAEYRTSITRNGFLGAVFFANVQSVSDWPSKEFTKVHPAVGGGLRIKFNKHANTNICIDYGVGMDGSKGVFVNLGEVF